ncbi:DUF5134 domain-containing protein [Actinophytocola sp.]|uniref:DUF5134 domain-containing protein n=1 Tax=Actinophytocola sp. TaxID=1872138 RepID=UPI002ED112AF
MAGPDWIRWTLTVLFLAVAAYCVTRLVVARHVPDGYRGCHRALDAAHGMMSFGMAVMCSPVGGPVPVAGWQAVFLVSTAWFVSAWWRRTATEPIGWHGDCQHHVVAGLAMLYMLTAMPHDPEHTAVPWLSGTHGAERALPFVGWLFAGYFFVHATVLGPRVVRAAAPGDTGLPAALTASRVTAACEVFMALGTGYLLVA